MADPTPWLRPHGFAHYQARLPAMERALRALGKTPELTVS